MDNKTKGSEWRKWDLHLHTPSSHDYGDKSVNNQDIIDGMVEKNISVFAITDHHEIDIERFHDLQQLGEKHGITVLPGIEFLSDAKGKHSVHFIGIFSENSNIDYIWGQIQNNTNIKKVLGENKKVDEVYCHLEDTIHLIKNLGGIVTIHAGTKSNTIENITHSLPHGTAQKTEVANLVDIYELGKEIDQEGYKKFVFPAIKKIIPMIICSDNHNIRKYIFKQNLWIKGATNFEGLKYALCEPEERFYIGEEPAVIRRVRENKTKYIKSLRVKRTGRGDQSHIWFEDLKIPLNSELVTIIGNKGSGKSALSDIIAMCADADHSNDYLFLHKNKFKKKGLADRFSAYIQFESDFKTDLRALSHTLQESDERKVRYLPQSYFEKVCNEIGKTNKFRKEIEKVTFQYVPIEDRLQQTSFKELIDYKSNIIDKEISNLSEQIDKINKKIIRIEDKTDPLYKHNLISKKKIKEDELATHLASKPKEKEDPSAKNETPEITKKKKDLNSFLGKKNSIQSDLIDVRRDISIKAVSLEELRNLKRDISNKVSDLEEFIKSKEEVTQNYNINLNSIIRIELNLNPIEQQIDNTKKDITKLQAELANQKNITDIDYEKLNLQTKLNYCEEKIKSIQSEFSGEQKEYQNYLRQLSEWEESRKSIEGNKELQDSLAYIQFELSYLENVLPKELERLRDDRLEISQKIFIKKEEIKQFYDNLKTQIDDQLSTSRVVGLSIESSFYTTDNFEESILRNIQQHRSGTFYGSEAGKNILHNNLVSRTNWNNSDSIKEFLSNFIEYVENDMRTESTSKVFIGDIIKERKELYDYLFSLNYLEPKYDLQQNNKSLEQLSPGEKGALLLVFYLVLDKEDIPLIVDQPEDNLDNNSVVQILVPYIREAKKKRQIIIVTHNPNLAVVSDSEQVIWVNIDKQNGNIFNFVSGGIEDAVINDKIVNVLEGTFPAFLTRRDKYQGA